MAKMKQISAMPTDEFRREREALGLTQRQLALALGVAEITVRKWENGSNPISPMVVRLLATLKPAPKSGTRIRRQVAAEVRNGN